MEIESMNINCMNLSVQHKNRECWWWVLNCGVPGRWWINMWLVSNTLHHLAVNTYRVSPNMTQNDRFIVGVLRPDNIYGHIGMGTDLLEFTLMVTL